MYRFFWSFFRKITFLSIHNLKIYAHLELNGFVGTCEGYLFFLSVEKQKCNYGGFRYFFNRSSCFRRMRKVYFFHRKFECRKCLNLGYRNQRLNVSDGFRETKSKIITAFNTPIWFRSKTSTKNVGNNLLEIAREN